MSDLRLSDTAPVERGGAASGSAERLSLWAAIVLGVAGLLVLFGWAQDIEELKTVLPGFTAMNPLTACCFVLAGLAIALNLAAGRIPSCALGMVIAVLGLLKIVDLTLIAVPIDKLLFTESLMGEIGSKPNSMAPNTAAAFLLVGLSLALATLRGREEVLCSQALGSTVLLISMFALVGYGFGIDPLHSVGPFIPMAIHTGLLLLVLSIGLLSLNADQGFLRIARDRGAAGSMARTILPLAVLIPIAVGAVRLWGQDQGYYGTEVGVALQVIANVLVTSVLLISSIIALYRSDLTRCRREEAVARSEDLYRLAETVANVGHWRIELPSLTIHWSDELFRICGRPKERGIPSLSELLKIFHPEDRSRALQCVRTALRDGSDWQYRIRLCRSGKDLRHVISHGVCETDAQGNVTALFGVLADVTELEQARHAAETATAGKAAFLANMSHEIRTPLNGVMGFAELLLASELKPEQARQATLIFESAHALLKLLNDILDVSKIDAGQWEVASEPFDVGHQLRQCVRLMTSTAEKKGLDLSLMLDPQLPRQIVGDGLRMRQVILNLLGNAVKFTDRGSVSVGAYVFPAATGQSQLQICVSDTGVGIPLERQASIFEEFVQADATISRRFGGSGLGLSISRRLVALMGGEIVLESKEGVGTRVTVTLPLKSVEHPTSSFDDQPVAPKAGGGVAQLGNACVLLVEDLAINQELITGMLDRMGCRVETASDGAEAIRLAEMLEAQPERYDLIFMDVQMPVVDGLAATRAIRTLGGRAAEIPIVALTANAFALEIEECRSAGMNDHLSKPVSMSTLEAALRHWLPNHRSADRTLGAGISVNASLAAKFALRVDNYMARLSHIMSTLVSEVGDERSNQLAELGEIAHSLAGTAAMFGRPALGELAAELEDRLRRYLPETAPSPIDRNLVEPSSTECHSGTVHYRPTNRCLT